MVRVAKVLRIPTASPADTSGLAAAVDSGEMPADGIIGIMGKVEGNGCVNDFTRGYSTQSLALCLAGKLGISIAEVEEKVALVMSGGTEGCICPHITVFWRGEDPAAAAPAPGAKRLALGVGFTRQFLPEEIGRTTQVLETVKAVTSAMKEAGIEDPTDVHFVQIKCPLLTKERMEAAHARGATTATSDTYSSMALSRGASALGVAVALGELKAEQIKDEDICHNWDLQSSVASTSAGIELMHNEILVLGNAPEWGGELQIAHAVMQDAIDTEAPRTALAALGITPKGQVTAAQRERIAAVLSKAEAGHSGSIRGRRHIMLDDSDIQPTRHARALVGGVLAGLFGDTCLYVSGGAEHQGPDGGAPIAVIAKAAAAGQM